MHQLLIGDSTAAVFNFTIPRGEKGESFTSVVSDDAPENPENGDAWFNSNVGDCLFITLTAVVLSGFKLNLYFLTTMALNFSPQSIGGALP